MLMAPRQHYWLAATIIDRANHRTRSEAKAEKAKLRALPRPDSTRLNRDQDDRPKNVMSPTSSWGSVKPEFLDEGFLYGTRP